MTRSQAKVAIADLVLGEYTAREVLGEGGSGTVYGARHEPTGRDVALKVLRADVDLTPKEVRRFIDEAAAMERVDHPSLVKVLQAGTLPDGRPFLAMPRLEGELLAERIERGPLPFDEAMLLFHQLAGALDALHAAGLVHRDIKPENVFVGRDEAGPRAVLLDFGIAREIDAPASTTTQAGKVRGTPAYMAPERFFGTPASVATDVYELGVLLYVMLVGRLPWNDTRDASGRFSPLRPASHGVALPAPVEAAVFQALSVRPEERPASASALSGELSRRTEWMTAETVAFTALPKPSLAEPTLPPTEYARTTSPTAQGVGASEVRPRRPALRVAAVALGIVVVGGTAAGLALVPRPGIAIEAVRDPGVATAVTARASASGAPLAPGDPSSPAASSRLADAGPRASSSAKVPPRASGSSPQPAPSADPPALPPGSADLPTCRRVLALYCSADFQRTELAQRGVLCSVWRGNVARWSAASPELRVRYDEACRGLAESGAAVLRERQRMLQDGGVPAPR